ncbi:MAG TPA: hypothetical protein VFO79_06435, partial [Xanthomonadales bacterium]|nr:hypothetical protein [Xanthomonadales bacterium]
TAGLRGTPTLERTATVGMGALAIAGFQRGTKRMLLGAELAGGVRAVSYNYRSKYFACEQSMSITAARPVLEARARASYFISPHAAIGAQLGSSLIDDEWNVGVFVGGYTRAFGLTR